MRQGWLCGSAAASHTFPVLLAACRLLLLQHVLSSTLLGVFENSLLFTIKRNLQSLHLDVASYSAKALLRKGMESREGGQQRQGQYTDSVWRGEAPGSTAARLSGLGAVRACDPASTEFR